MAISSSLKNILSSVKQAGKNIAGSIDVKKVAKTFDEDGFVDAVKSVTSPIATSTVDGAKDIGKTISKEFQSTEAGKNIVDTANKVTDSYVGRKVKGTVDGVGSFYRNNTYNHSAYEAAKEKYKTEVKKSKDAVKPKQRDYKTGHIIDKDPDTFTGYRFNKLTSGASWGIGLGTLAIGSAIGLVDVAGKEKERLAHGDIYADVSVGTINASFSPTHNKVINSIVSNNNTEASKKVGYRNLSGRVADVNPEIVFALHQLRNGGGM